MNGLIRVLPVLLVALLLAACGEVADNDSLDGLTPDCTPDARGIACADDPTRAVTYTGPGWEGGVACTVTSTPAYGYSVCE